jgi:small subunit ribosomal protein S21
LTKSAIFGIIDELDGTPQKGGENTMATILVEDSENLEKAIKRFKRMVEKEGIIREWKKREYYEKPSTILNRKNKTLARKLMKKNRKPHDSRASY